jgi:hypothetical protein
MIELPDNRIKMKEKLQEMFASNRGKYFTLSNLREVFFGYTDNEWVAMCQRIILGNLVAKIRNETGLHIYRITMNGNTGYKIIETKEEFEQVLIRSRGMLMRLSEKIMELKRDMSSEEYRRKVERFYKKPVSIGVKK